MQKNYDRPEGHCYPNEPASAQKEKKKLTGNKTKQRPGNRSIRVKIRVHMGASNATDRTRYHWTDQHTGGDDMHVYI